MLHSITPDNSLSRKRLKPLANKVFRHDFLNEPLPVEDLPSATVRLWQICGDAGRAVAVGKGKARTRMRAALSEHLEDDVLSPSSK